MSLKHSRVLFVEDNGRPMEFYMRPCREKTNLKPLIEHGGGYFTTRNGKNVIRLIEPGSKVLNFEPEEKVVSIQFIQDSVKSNRLLNLDDYVVKVNSLSISDISDDEENSYTIQTSSRNLKKRKYSKEDEAKILEYVLKNYNAGKSKAFWCKLIKENNIDRSWCSVRSHFYDHMMPRLDADSSNKQLRQLISTKRNVYKYYTYVEDLAIINYIIKNNKFNQMKSRNLYIEMANENVTVHSHSSMRTRFRSHILPNINRYNIPYYQMKRICQKANIPLDDENLCGTRNEKGDKYSKDSDAECKEMKEKIIDGNKLQEPSDAECKEMKEKIIDGNKLQEPSVVTTAVSNIEIHDQPLSLVDIVEDVFKTQNDEYINSIESTPDLLFLEHTESCLDSSRDTDVTKEDNCSVSKTIGDENDQLNSYLKSVKKIQEPEMLQDKIMSSDNHLTLSLCDDTVVQNNNVNIYEHNNENSLILPDTLEEMDNECFEVRNESKIHCGVKQHDSSNVVEFIDDNSENASVHISNLRRSLDSKLHGAASQEEKFGSVVNQFQENNNVSSSQSVIDNLDGFDTNILGKLQNRLKTVLKRHQENASSLAVTVSQSDTISSTADEYEEALLMAPSSADIIMKSLADWPDSCSRNSTPVPDSASDIKISEEHFPAEVKELFLNEAVNLVERLQNTVLMCKQVRNIDSRKRVTEKINKLKLLLYEPLLAKQVQHILKKEELTTEDKAILVKYLSCIEKIGPQNIIDIFTNYPTDKGTPPRKIQRKV